MKSWLTRGRIAFCCLLLLAAAVLGFRISNGLQLGLDLFSLATADTASLIREVADGTANRGSILIEGRDETAVKDLAERVASNLQQSARLDFTATLRYLDNHKSGLLAPETRELLREGKYREVAEDSMARLFGMLPPLFPVKRDPFLLATAYAMSLQSNVAEGWMLKDGYPVCEKEDRYYLLLALEPDVVQRVGDRVLMSLLEAAERDNEHRDEKIWCCGPLFHTLVTTRQSQREINVLSFISIVAVVILGWLLFRSVRFIPCLLFSIGSAFLVATAVLLGICPRAHILTFVFGTSLIGLSVDYVYHACSAGGAVQIVRPLTQSLLTTLACFVPLFCAGVSVLREMALFVSVGLVTAYTSVFVVGTTARTAVGGREIPLGWRMQKIPRGVRLGLMVVLTSVVFAGLHFLSLNTSPTAFYRPIPYLAASEARLTNLNPALSSRFAYVRGETLQAALEREEAVGLKGFSSIVPSLKRQQENADLIRKLSVAEGTNYHRQTGLNVGMETHSFLDAENLEDAGLRRLVKTFRARQGLIVPCPKDFVSKDPNVVVIEPRATLEHLFSQYFGQTMKLLGFSLLALTVLLAILFRRRFFKIVGPIGFALVGTVAALGWLQIPVTFFTLLCFFVLIGLGLDYVIFNQTHPTVETRRTVFYSFLTSLVGLGMLSFTAFPVTHDMGLTFALGLTFAYLFSVLASHLSHPATLTSQPSQHSQPSLMWHTQQEQSAGRFRIAVLWFLYRWVGKGCLKIVCVLVMAFIYPFAKPARKALREFYGILWKGQKTPSHWKLFNHLLGFAWSLADKTDACTVKKNLPKMSLRLDDGGRAFQDLVAAKKGAFLISTHVGTIEVLPALAAQLPQGEVPPVHAFQQMGHDAVFTHMFMKHFDASKLTLHAVEDIGVETAVQMQEAIGRGELVLMAGDRVSAGSNKTLSHEFLGRSCQWPKGVFTFAKLMESPIFFTTCVRTGWNAYEVHFSQFQPSSLPRQSFISSLLSQYLSFLTTETLAHPEQWYQFYTFFSHPSHPSQPSQPSC